ncbi:hypothetical protein V2L05_03225 [Pseudomonas alliivorans]|nr:hypothetical protein [Pseudomonas alliivorans]MEE4732756.1 hypothetical protein [Pseudomonas alliivorans]MEE4883836.1 hypothetical protein [Pseudomonas alliivorans]MEE4962278.1 hypothetical protein [Pseudomonas alliivorans]MEE4970471.1 hypothetical protein [Pseudomonas alliivorans]
MRYVIGCLMLSMSSVSMATEAQLKQWEKMDRCSNAAYFVVNVLESSADGMQQEIALQGSIKGLKTNTKLGADTPTENEMRGSYNFLLRVSAGMPRPYAKREHDWLIAQAASACSLWIPD